MIPLRDLETRMRKAAADLETAARLRDELKRLKLIDLKFANEVMTPAGGQVDAAEPGRLRAEAAERYRKGRR